MYIRTEVSRPLWPRGYWPSPGGFAGLGNGKAVPIRENEVKKLIQAADAEVGALLKNVRVPCPRKAGLCVFEPVRTATIQGAEHVWRLAITGNIGDVSVGGEPILLPGKTLSLKPVTTAARGKTTVTRRIVVFVNPTRLTWDTPDLRKRIPDKQKRIEFHFSMTLYHELIHAMIIIEQGQPGGGQTALFAEFQRLVKAANLPALRSYRDAVKAEIRGLMALAGAAVPDVEAELDRQLEFLLHEWFASRRAANAFGRPQTNAQAASGYSAVVAVRVKSLGSPPADNRTWKLRVLQLGQAVTAWFDATAIPEMTPRGGRVGPIITVEPPILRL